MDGYVLFRKDRPARRGGGVALHWSGQPGCIELCLAVDAEQIASLWVRIKGQASMGDTVVFATGHLLRKRKSVWPSTDSWQ